MVAGKRNVPRTIKSTEVAFFDVQMLLETNNSFVVAKRILSQFFVDQSGRLGFLHPKKWNL